MHRTLRSVLFATLFGAAALTGCDKEAGTTAGSSGATTAEGGNAHALGFQYGAPITDTSIVAIAERTGGKSDTLTADEFNNRMMAYVQQNPMLLADSVQARELRRAIVESFVVQPLLLEAVDKDTTIRVDSAQVNAEIARARGPMTDEQFQEQLTAMNMTIDSVRAIVSKQLRQQALIEAWSKGATQPTVQEVETYRKKMAEQVRVAHIIFATRDVPAAKHDSVRRVAEAVLDSAKGGTDFAALARRHSMDGTAATGGVIDFFGRDGQLDYAFKKASFALRDSGDVSPQLVESAFGYHVIKMLHRREGALADTASVRAQMMETRKTDAVRDRARQMLTELGVKVRVNEAILKADLNDPLIQDPESI